MLALDRAEVNGGIVTLILNEVLDLLSAPGALAVELQTSGRIGSAGTVRFKGDAERTFRGKTAGLVLNHSGGGLRGPGVAGELHRTRRQPAEGAVGPGGESRSQSPERRSWFGT